MMNILLGNGQISDNLKKFSLSKSMLGPGHGSIVPYQAFPTSDSRFLIVGAGNDAHFVSLCRLLSLSDLESDPRFATNQGEPRFFDELRE